jgi:hypothetical protein
LDVFGDNNKKEYKGETKKAITETVTAFINKIWRNLLSHTVAHVVPSVI